jgi:hypothetical protein
MMVHNFGEGAGRTASDAGIRSVGLEFHEPIRSSLVEWVWGFLEDYPLSYPARGVAASSTSPRRPSRSVGAELRP